MGTQLDLDSVYKDIGTFGSVGLKHRVVLFSKGTDGNNRPYVNQYKSTKSKGGSAGLMSYYFRRTTNALILESTEPVSKVKNSIYFTQEDTMDSIRFLDEALNWFKDPEIKNNLFEYEGNNPYKVSDKYNKLHSMMCPTHGLRGAFVSIQPAVINDFRTRLGYPGVVIKGVTGVVGCCTVKEFENLVHIFKRSMLDLHSISMELLNHYMMCKLIGV